MGITKTAKKILTKKKPEKRLLLPLKKTGGRNVSGKITVRHRGGGAKRMYRIVDFGQEKLGVRGKIIALEYDPNRTAFIALVEYQDGEKRYILADIPIGTEVYNIELEPGRGGRLVRSAGTSAKVVAQEGKYTLLEMPSKEIRKILSECFASIGHVSHPEHRFEELGKAGKKRLRGWRPTVRGSAMNPCDHPHGGGEGRAPIGLKHPKTPWGKPALGVKTRKKKWTDKLIIKKRK